MTNTPIDTMKDTTVRLNLGLPSKQFEKITRIAEEEGNTAQAVIRTFCTEGLKRRAATEAA